MSGWSRVLLVESANPAGANRASWPGYMVGTLWADKVLPGNSTRNRQEKTGQERHATGSRDTRTHTHTHTGTDETPVVTQTITQMTAHTTTQRKTDEESSQKCSSSEPVAAYTHMHMSPSRKTHAHIYAHGCINTEMV